MPPANQPPLALAPSVTPDDLDEVMGIALRRGPWRSVRAPGDRIDFGDLGLIGIVRGRVRTRGRRSGTGRAGTVSSLWWSSEKRSAPGQLRRAARVDIRRRRISTMRRGGMPRARCARCTSTGRSSKGTQSASITREPDLTRVGAWSNGSHELVYTAVYSEGQRNWDVGSIDDGDGAKCLAYPTAGKFFELLIVGLGVDRSS